MCFLVFLSLLFFPSPLVDLEGEGESTFLLKTEIPKTHDPRKDWINYKNQLIKK